jgi:hypothetical protein
MPLHAATKAPLNVLAASLNHRYHVSDTVGPCTAPAHTLFHACSNPEAAVALVRRRVYLPVTLSTDTTSTVTYAFEPDVDFVGAVYLLVHAPVLVNQCAAPTTSCGSALGTATLKGIRRCIVPADADRPGSFAGLQLDEAVVKEGVPGCALHADFGDAGAQFGSVHQPAKSSPLDQNATQDFAAYFTEYAAARIVRSARLVASGVEVSALTCDVLAAAHELFHTKDAASARGAAGAWNDKTFAHLGQDADMKAALKVHSLGVQTWRVPLPFFPKGEAFPNALLRHYPVTNENSSNHAKNANAPATSLRLELTFSPLYELVCNGSDTLPSNARLTAAHGQVAVRTVTFPAHATDTSAFASGALALRADQAEQAEQAEPAEEAEEAEEADFEAEHFRVVLEVHEYFLDPDSVRALVSGEGRRTYTCARVRPLEPLELQDPRQGRVSLSSVEGLLETVVWFPRLRMDAFRHMWYRMRGLVDQATGRATHALADLVVIGNYTFVGLRAHTDKEVYVCDFAGAINSNPMGAVMSNSMGAIAPPTLACCPVSDTDALHCAASANVFADNSATGGLDPTRGCGGPPAVTVLAFAIERQTLEFCRGALVRVV